MKQPITPEIERLVQNGLKFRIEQDLNIIINEQNSYYRSVEKKLAWNDGWFVNGESLDGKDLQIVMGKEYYEFNNFNFGENDHILIYVKSLILSDEEFTVSTGLKTQVLWNFYSPSIKSEFVFKNGTFIKQ
jgi:hypothetical protein